jgi:hypothetical protein
MMVGDFIAGGLTSVALHEGISVPNPHTGVGRELE